MSCIYGPHQFGTEDQGWVAHFLIRALRGRADHDLRRRQAGARRALRRRSGRRVPAARASSIDGARRARRSTSAAARATRSACSSCSSCIEALTRRDARRRVRRLAGRRPALLRLRHPASSSARPAGRRGSASREGVAAAAPRGSMRRATPSARQCARRRGRVMRVALVNPTWTFDGSIYFGCREPHLPLEYGYAQALLDARRARGARSSTRSSTAVDATDCAERGRARSRPTSTVVTTAPSYLFWRCAPPELRVPAADRARALRDRRGTHGRRRAARARPRRARRCASSASMRSCSASARRSLPRSPTPRDRVARGRRRSPDADDGEIRGPRRRRRPPTWRACRRCAGRTRRSARHAHHHHRFDAAPHGPGRRDGGVARLPVSLHLLREGQFPRRLPQAPARHDARRSSTG